MKRYLILLIAFLALGVSYAHAQIMPDYLSVSKGQFYDQDGNAIDSAELRQIIGNEIYNATYVGANKQYKVGKKLILWGAIGAGVGLVSYVACVAGIASNQLNGSSYRPGEDPLWGGVMAGATLLVLGDCALAAGIPLTIIGKSRMNWIANDYNEKQQSRVSVNLTGCSAGYGLGLAINF